MMKIPKSLRDTHATRKEIYEQLKQNVDEVIRNQIDVCWHYESRVKALESFALKVETGQYDPGHLEDFFACTIVVENLGSMSRAEKLVRANFSFYERRPKSDSFTSKPSDSFRFDDTRLYMSWKDSPDVRPTGLHGLLFEVQIKTYLAHAWSIATHDLTYKTDRKSWAKERIAYQIKAMLEHAEISIQQAQNLARSTALKKTDDVSRRISETIRLVNDLWPPAFLPEDRKRLAENINALITNVGIDLKSLRKILEEETRLGRGTSTLNLSPYATIVQSLFNQRLGKMKKYVTGLDRDFKVFLPRELELPPSLESTKLTNVILGTAH